MRIKMSIEKIIKPTKEQIEKLKQEGYSVFQVADFDNSPWKWMHAKGAAQEKNKQPYRPTALQAWKDCQDYAACDGLPFPPDAHWNT